MMGTDFDTMMGSNGGTGMFFGWIAYILIIGLIVLGIIALWKYIQR